MVHQLDKLQSILATIEKIEEENKSEFFNKDKALKKYVEVLQETLGKIDETQQDLNPKSQIPSDLLLRLKKNVTEFKNKLEQMKDGNQTTRSLVRVDERLEQVKKEEKRLGKLIAIANYKSFEGEYLKNQQELEKANNELKNSEIKLAESDRKIEQEINKASNLEKEKIVSEQQIQQEVSEINETLESTKKYATTFNQGIQQGIDKIINELNSEEKNAGKATTSPILQLYIL
jgi:chromosome segregation ATPase